VSGLAPYQNAAEVLNGEGLNAKNVRAWLATQHRLDRVQSRRARPAGRQDVIAVCGAKSRATSLPGADRDPARARRRVERAADAGGRRLR